MSFIGPILRPAVKQLGRYVYQGLRQQEKIIDYTYRKTGLYNRGVVRGIKHGLAGGQVIGGGLSLGLNAPDSPGNDASSVPFYGPSARKPYQTRDRQTVCYRVGSYRKYKRDNSKRQSYYR